MSIVIDNLRSNPAGILGDANRVILGLVNNMPDAAFEATERQFVDLIRSATPDATVCVKLYTIAKVRRGKAVQQTLAGRYCDIAELWDTRLDGLIVTGTEPHAEKLTDEPYWLDMAKMIDWAEDNTLSAIWSCLAAHAAVLHTSGIERRALSEKMFGVFACETLADHWLMSGAAPLQVPHSRYNDLAAAELVAGGYDLLAVSAAAGVDCFARRQRASFFVFFQGHPEYQAELLLREYRRDIGRYLRGEREYYPALPRNYFSDDAARLAGVFRAGAIADRRPALLNELPFAALAAGLDGGRRGSALVIYRNWIDYLKGRKAIPTRPARSLRQVHRSTGVRSGADILAG